MPVQNGDIRLASRQRRCDYGILLATNGVTGVPEDLTRAHFEIAAALRDGIRVLVVTPADIEGMADTDELVDLIKAKLCQLIVSGTNLL